MSEKLKLQEFPRVGDKVRILANFYTKGLEICGQQAIIISTYTNERPKQVKVQLQNGDKYYLLLSEIEKISEKIYCKEKKA